jgi:hypothetical protein
VQFAQEGGGVGDGPRRESLKTGVIQGTRYAECVPQVSFDEQDSGVHLFLPIAYAIGKPIYPLEETTT